MRIWGMLVLIVTSIISGGLPAQAVSKCNQAPIAGNDKAILYGRHTSVEVKVLHNDSDPGKCDLKIVSFSRGSRGRTRLHGTRIWYEYLGLIQPLTDSFTYTIENSAGKTATATVNVVLYPPNLRPPQIQDESIVGYVNYWQHINVLQNDSDPDGVGTGEIMRVVDLKFDMDSAWALIGKYYPETVWFKTYKSGPFTFTYVVRSEATGLTSTGQIHVDVREPVPPIANEDFATTKPGQRVEIDVLKNDTIPVHVDRGTGLRVTGIDTKLTPQPLQGKFQFADNKIFWTPDTNASGTYVFYYLVRDGYIGAQSSGKVTVTIQP